MAKQTRAEVEAQIAELQKRLADDDDLTLLVEDDAGRKTHLKGAHAAKWLAKLGLDDDDDQAEEDEEEEDPAPPKGKLRARFFETG